MTTTTAAPDHASATTKTEKYATPKEGAAFLGVPVNTFYKMCLSRVIPSYKMGKLRRVKLSEVAAFAEASRVEARPGK
jgi:excisionase family DNA binding protein